MKILNYLFILLVIFNTNLFASITEREGNNPGSTSGEFRNTLSFSALKDDGSVVTWGNSSAGGDSVSVSSSLSSGVVKVFSNHHAFAALKDDASVVTWGVSSNGGDSSAVSSSLSSGVVKVFSTEFAFAALKDDGSVITWGGFYWRR